jgi:hypothetical protein
MSYRDDLVRAVREGERAARKLSKLDDLPDFDAFPNGAALALVVGYPSGDPYTYLALRQKDLWYFTGGSQAPHAYSSDQVVEWFTKSPRRLLGLAVLAELELVQVPAIDLGNLLALVQERASRLPKVCQLSDCGCSGQAHP